jgi:hypothetical protein
MSSSISFLKSVLGHCEASMLFAHFQEYMGKSLRGRDPASVADVQSSLKGHTNEMGFRFFMNLFA